MLKELDHSKLPVIQELDPNMLDRPFDKGNKYSPTTIRCNRYWIQR